MMHFCLLEERSNCSLQVVAVLLMTWAEISCYVFQYLKKANCYQCYGDDVLSSAEISTKFFQTINSPQSVKEHENPEGDIFRRCSNITIDLTFFLISYFFGLCSIHNKRFATMLSIIAAAGLISPLLLQVLAQEGQLIPGSAASTSGPAYSCDLQTCVAPSCYCASKDPPAGMAPSDTPQFLSITFDDAIQPQLLETAYKMLNVRFVSTSVNTDGTGL